MGRAQKLKQQRRDEERRKQLERIAKRKRALAWSMGLTLAAAAVALVLVVVLVRLPVYVKQMVIETERGNIVVELKGADAPRTSAHMEKLVKQGSYRGARFYQVDEVAAMTGIRSRDPSANIDAGTRSAAAERDAGVGTVADEVGLPNVRGAVAMAKPSDPSTQRPLPDSATHEFYILKSDAAWLDPDFTVFGMVAEGLEAVDGLGLNQEIASFTLDDTGRYLTIAQSTGDIVIELKPEDAPLTVQHFTDLVRSGFYSGMNWYRVEDWVVQTGSHARSLEASASMVEDPSLKLEESATVPPEGKLPAVRGAVLLYWMAEPAEEAEGYMPENATEFLIMKQDYSEQVGTAFTVFGEVVEGMPVVDSLQSGDVIKTIFVREVRRD